MLKLIGFFLKLCAFSVIVLVLGQLVRWDGKSVSDQVKVRISHAEGYTAEHGESIFERARQWARELLGDALEGSLKKKATSRGPASAPPKGFLERLTISAGSSESVPSAATAANDSQASTDAIQASERQKLKALIKELNKTH